MDVSAALTLLMIGMITVFVVLLLVVLVGNLLIYFVNRFLSSEDSNSGSAISSKEVAVLTAAVEAVTQGQGTITKIEKIR